ncbi:MAG: Retron-type reverse transcriptase [Parcubacteria group bacterium GW2011_GWC1_44_10]|nr:MAG: Retron-type reverse transcriptase [Parcubacteria group bacterium GW2011_GWC1_44_10]
MDKPVGGGAFNRFCHTYEHIISVENLLEAWKEFLNGKRGKRDVQEFHLNLMDNILALHQDLKNKTYTHGPYHAFNISDPKPRNIHKASVRDRLLHHAIYRVLYPYFDKKFISDSYSCRINKGTHKALERFKYFAGKVSKNNTKQYWILKCDIKKFFASIDHDSLRYIVLNYIEDENVIWLLTQIIESFETAPSKGLPLGNLTSQLLVNVYMNKFDQFVKHKLKIRYYIRYADDFVFLSHDKNHLVGIVRYIELFLNEKLKLQLHPDKVFIKTLSSGVDFLGWVHFPDHRVLRTVTKRRMRKNLSINPSEESRASYLGMLKHGNAYKLKQMI